jgi:hypothetical protein
MGGEDIKDILYTQMHQNKAAYNCVAKIFDFMYLITLLRCAKKGLQGPQALKSTASIFKTK